jgi:preprotein translocase subunit SecE
MFDYFKQVRSEMRHVVWPSREMTIIYTVVVIAISIGIAVYLGLLDYLFSLVLKRLI